MFGELRAFLFVGSPPIVVSKHLVIAVIENARRPAWNMEQKLWARAA